MITVRTDRCEYSVEIEGHAGYCAEKGKDIVCAAVSILYYTFCGMLTEHESQLLSLEMGEGDGAYRIKWCPQEGYAGIIDTIYESFLMGIRLLHEHYPNNVILINKG